jgi:hypothetical protein
MNSFWSAFNDELTKTAKEEDKINWKKLLGYTALTGLIVGGLKGTAEEALKRKIGWPLARGLTSAGAGIGYGAATALGLRKSKKKKKGAK